MEALKASHFSTFSLLKKPEIIPWLQSLLVRSWIGQAERNLSGLIPTRQPTCLLALERNIPITLILVQPTNKRGSCWSIGFSEILTEPENYSIKFIYTELLKKALEILSNRAQSWLIRSSTCDQDLIALARELGFQPIKFFNCWEPPSNYGESKLNETNTLPEGLEWQQLNRNNVQALCKLDQTRDSVYLRQILDRQWHDLLTTKSNLNGVLTNKYFTDKNIIMGFLCRNWPIEQSCVEILRDLIWDDRISVSLPVLLNDLCKSNQKFLVETCREDKELYNVLSNLKWSVCEEKVLLARTIWRRRENNRMVLGTRPLESILGRLNPQRPPLPTPSLGRR